MLASSSNQISSFIPFMMNQSTSLEKSIQIHDDHENENYSISRFEQSLPPSLQLVDCYNYNFNPFLEEEFILGHILYSQTHQLLGTASHYDPEIGLETANYNTNSNEATVTTQKASSSQKKAKLTEHTSKKKPISRRRSGKKDRHSKICTSKGPRDRRMRLSLEIARSFFDLQDMLGFDKASKTVEWLFAKSRSAIKELKDKYKNNYATKSGYEEGSNDVRKISVYEEAAAGRDQKKRRKLRIVDKESRYKARARARERTRAKRDFEGNPVGDCKIGDVLLEEAATKSKIVLEERQQTHVSSHTETEIILGSKPKNSPSFISNHCEDKLVSKQPCSYDILLPASSMDMAATMSFDSLKPLPAGLKLMELDEIDGALIFYGE